MFLGLNPGKTSLEGQKILLTLTDKHMSAGGLAHLGPRYLTL